MARDILVSIMGDDVFARNWMSMLLVRDWRTRVVSEIDCLDDFMDFKENQIQKVDVLLVDLDSFSDHASIFDQIIENIDPKMPIKVVCVASNADSRILKMAPEGLLNGYVLKREIGTSLAWAVTFVSEGNFILTPSTQACFYNSNISLPKKYMVLSSKPVPGLTDRQSEISRLAIIFSIGRRDLADELKISDQWSYGMVSELYEKLGLGNLFQGESDPYRYIDEDPTIREHLTEILAELGESKKARDLETLAFHLITMPMIDEHRNNS